MTGEQISQVDPSKTPEVSGKRVGVSWQLKRNLHDVATAWGQTETSEDGGTASESFLELPNGQTIGIFTGRDESGEREQLMVMAGMIVMAEHVVKIPPTRGNPTEVYWDLRVDPKEARKAIRIVDTFAIATGNYDIETKTRKPIHLPKETNESMLDKVMEELKLDNVAWDSLPPEIKITLLTQSVRKLAESLVIGPRLADSFNQKFDSIFEQVLTEAGLTREEYQKLEGEKRYNISLKAAKKFTRTIFTQENVLTPDE